MTDTEKNEETSFCTVTRLMALADEWAEQCGGCDSSHLAAHSKHRAALEAELTRLFIPMKCSACGQEWAEKTVDQYAHFPSIPGLRVDPVTGNIGFGERNDRHSSHPLR